MSDYKTDDEKVEELKAWWKENGTSVVVGVALSIVALFGWDYWKKSQEATAAEASAIYAQTSKTAQVDLMKALPNVQKLQNDYASTPYAVIASLQTAQQHAEKGEYEPALKALQWVIDNSKEEGFTQLANIRLARVLLAMKKPDEALQIANKTYPVAYEALIAELKGDIYAAQNKPKEAREAYDKAIASTEGGSTELIQMKRDNLGAG